MPTYETQPAARHVPLPFLGLACAVGVSTIYYNQPLLLEMGHTYHAADGHTGFVSFSTQIGYACGLLLFVPLGDVLERRALMMRMYGAVTAALLLVAFAPTLTWLIAASAVAGSFAAVTHIVVPIAPDLASNEERGRAVGIVMTGLLLGILLARTFAGWVSHVTGWRSVFMLAAAINAAFVPMLWRVMPRLPPKGKLTYPEAMRSLYTLFRRHVLLRESCAMGGLVFASFSCFWTTLVLVLHSHYNLGAGVAGSFGLVGAAGAMVAPVAGRLSDRRGPRFVVAAGLGLLTLATVVLWAEEKATMPLTLHMVALGIGVIVLDTGAQLCQVANQTRIFGLDPGARSRLNTVYMTTYFSGAAIGSALATEAWTHWQWNGVSGLALLLIGLAVLRHVTGTPDSAEQRAGTGAEALHA